MTAEVNVIHDVLRSKDMPVLSLSSGKWSWYPFVSNLRTVIGIEAMEDLRSIHNVDLTDEIKMELLMRYNNLYKA